MSAAFEVLHSDATQMTATKPRGRIGSRLASTAVLVAAGLAAWGALALLPSPLRNSSSRVMTAAPAPVSSSVRVVTENKWSDIPCAQQSVPYVDPQCRRANDRVAVAPAALPATDEAKSEAAAIGGAKVEAAREPAPTKDNMRDQQVATPARELSAPVAQTPAPQTTAASAPAMIPDAAPLTADEGAPIVLANVPLPVPRPDAADAADDDVQAAPPPRRQTRSARRHAYSNPGARLVRQLNRIVPFGIIRF
ncbi:MAG: hypothetical protein AB7K04_12650 [Pseudorhodoplanes sp.]